jgi:hypothetical protein
LAQDAGPDDGCALAASEVVAPLRARLPKGMTLVQTKTVHRHVTQTVTLGWLTSASRVTVKRVDLGPNLRKGLNAITAALLLQSLSRAKVSKSHADLPCGEAIGQFELAPGEA